MLVISLRSGQSLVIGEAKVTLITDGKRIKVLIDADKSINVRRTELADRKVENDA